MDNDIEIEKGKKSDSQNEIVSGENSGFGQTESARSEKFENRKWRKQKNPQDEDSADEQEMRDAEARSELLKNDEKFARAHSRH